MTETTIGQWHYRWFPSTTTLVASRNQHCFDAALEPTVRKFYPTTWLDVNGHSIPVVSVNGHTAEDVLRAFKEVVA